MKRQYQIQLNINPAHLDTPGCTFDIVNRDLLLKRLEIFGIPEDVRLLIKNWLNERLFYVECAGYSSAIHEDNSGTIQGSVLGPVLFCF